MGDPNLYYELFIKGIYVAVLLGLIALLFLGPPKSQFCREKDSEIIFFYEVDSLR
jgi:hypothetical protein